MLQKGIGAKQLEAFPFQLPDAFRFTGLCSCISQVFAVLFLGLFNPGSERVAVDAELVSSAFDVVWLGGWALSGFNSQTGGGSFADLFQEVGWHLVGGLSLKTWILSLGSGA